jgi:hypothetical protein
VVTYHATTKSMAFKQTIGELKHGKLKGGETEVFNNERLHIPPVSNSYLHGCKIIDINYFVEVILSEVIRAFVFRNINFSNIIKPNEFNVFLH